MEATVKLLDYDNTIRKRWLGLLIVSFCFSLLLSPFQAIDAMASPELQTTGAKVLFVLGVVLGHALAMGMNYFLYRVSYKKPGTFWLTCSVVTTPFVLITNCKEMYELLGLPGGNHWSFAILLLTTGMYVWNAILSWQMRAINKKIQYQLSYGSERYAEAELAFKEATTMQGLKQVQHTATQGQPRFFVKAIKQLYQMRKSELLYAAQDASS